MSELTGEKRLRAILCGQFGDYGLKPQDSSFLIQVRAPHTCLNKGLAV